MQIDSFAEPWEIHNEDIDYWLKRKAPPLCGDCGYLHYSDGDNGVSEKKTIYDIKIWCRKHDANCYVSSLVCTE